MNRNRIAASAAVLTTAFVAALIAALSAGASTTKGSIHVYSVSDGTPPGHFVVTGAIHGAGTSGATLTDHGHVQLTTASLPAGTIVLDTTKAAAAVAKGLDAGDQATCTAVFTFTVPETILRGTGAYAGARGELTAKGSVAAVATKESNGQCGPVNVVAWSHATGSISFH